MAVLEERQRERIGARLLSHAENWAAGGSFRLIVLHARVGAEGFYLRLGYRQEGDHFDENTIPHIAMVKQLG